MALARQYIWKLHLSWSILWVWSEHGQCAQLKSEKLGLIWWIVLFLETLDATLCISAKCISPRPLQLSNCKSQNRHIVFFLVHGLSSSWLRVYLLFAVHCKNNAELIVKHWACVLVIWRSFSMTNMQSEAGHCCWTWYLHSAGLEHSLFIMTGSVLACLFLCSSRANPTAAGPDECYFNL